MDNEGWSRPLPKRPYRPTDHQLHVPVVALTTTIDLLRAVHRVETGVLWYGPADHHGGTVAYVVAPPQSMSWGNYHISAHALATLVQRLPDGWRPLAQIHSHPGHCVQHSRYDDEMTSSRRALSLVFPCYGSITEPFPRGIGIHEWQDGYWYLLDLEDATRRVVLTEGTVRVEDLR